MASLRIPRLSPEATEFINSIAPRAGEVLETDSLTQIQIEELLTVLEVELETTPDGERTRAIGEFAAVLIQVRKF